MTKAITLITKATLLEQVRLTLTQILLQGYPLTESRQITRKTQLQEDHTFTSRSVIRILSASAMTKPAEGGRYSHSKRRPFKKDKILLPRKKPAEGGRSFTKFLQLKDPSYPKAVTNPQTRNPTLTATTLYLDLH